MLKYSMISLCLFASSVLPTAAVTNKLLIPVPVTGLSPAKPVVADHFTFVVGGDNRSTGHGYAMPPSLDQICGEIGIIRPSFTLWTGDSIEGYGDTAAEAEAEYDVFLKSAVRTGVPMFSSPGNHEFSLDSSLLPIYTKRMGPLYGSFDYGNSHFISVNTTPVRADGTVASATLDDQQWKWLEDDLQSNKGAQNVFVMLHHFVFGPPDPDTPKSDTGWAEIADRDRFHALMVKYGVRAVFAGHNHIYYHTIKDGVDYYISGGAGAPLDATPDKGGFLHYVVMTVDGVKVTPAILQPWHLLQEHNADGLGHATITNTNDVDVELRNVKVKVAGAPRIDQLQVNAVAAYKKQGKILPATLLSISPNADGTSTVSVGLNMPAKRSVDIAISAAP